MTLAEIMADSGHYSIDSTTVRARVSTSGEKGGLIDALLAARGAASPASFTAWQMPSDDHSPSIEALIGLPERAPGALLADKGYDADAIRADLAKRNIDPVIPGRSNRWVKIEHDRTIDAQPEVFSVQLLQDMKAQAEAHHKEPEHPEDVFFAAASLG